MRVMLPNEVELYKIVDGGLTVTSHRVWRSASSWGRMALQTALLEQISYCRVARTSKPWLAVVALASLGAGAIAQAAAPEVAAIRFGMAGAVGFAFLFWFSLATELWIWTTCGRPMVVSGPSYETLTLCMDAIEAAKSRRAETTGGGAPTRGEGLIGLSRATGEPATQDASNQST